MNKKSLLALISVTPMILTACSGTIDYKDESHFEDYVYNMNYRDGFNILQLTDIHWNATSSTLASKKYLEKVLAEANAHTNGKIDLVEITGDQFMLANTYHVETFMAFFEEQAEKYGFMYTVIWGNHDRHGLYNPNWLSQQFRNAKHCIYLEPEDNLYGRSNFVINLLDNGVAKWQIANIDSGASFSETAVSPFRVYDYIRDEQVDWWKLQHHRVGDNVPTIAYYHIPQLENQKLWDELHAANPAAHKSKWFKLEGFTEPEENYESKLIKEGKSLNLKACFMGHAHNDDWTVQANGGDYDGVVIGLGVKTGTELYYAHIDPNNVSMPEETEGLASLGTSAPTEKFDLIGASLVTLTNATGDFDLEHLYLNERETNDFVLWTKW